jgi:hypothetical protein
MRFFARRIADGAALRYCAPSGRGPFPAVDSVMAGFLHCMPNDVKKPLPRFVGGTPRLSGDHFITNAIRFC